MVNTKKIKKATIWSSIETLLSTVLSIFSILFLARVLAPNDYGQIATAQFIVGLLQIILSLGLNEAIIQRKLLVKKDIQTIWTGSIFLSILCCLMCIIIGVYFSFINNKILSYILYFEAVNSFLFMLSIVPTALLIRDLEMKVFAHRAIISRIVFFIVAIPLAFSNFGLWSIVYANLVQTCIATLLILYASKHLIPRKFFFNKKRFIAITKFGFFVMVENVLWSVVSKVFGLLIAVFHGSAALGFYNMGTKLTDIILNILNTSIIRIALPIFSSIQHDKSKLLYAFQASTYYFNLISLPAFFGMALTSNYWVPVILGEKWIAITPIVQIIAVMYGIMYSRIFVGVAIKALGRSKDFLFLSLTSAIITVCAVFFTRNSELYITLLALAIPRILITYPLGMYLIKKICGFSFLSQIKPIIFPFIVNMFCLLYTSQPTHLS
ncbi:oligosaccharide flippase family protein [Entomomonas asaccharolytica]|uniref:Oligosaccharide flippase family protein n=1 Tax=Entomomonas asaccharolytica TaxID=2785331 RepID=A0A974NGU8_9GAMM|nr:oligosaccharide flippase family protein [Entomomonas asaccharolytica]QQP86386.1 oligosaccharide flippase family protein [Entomomonas asaccharolytica]